MTEKSQDIFAYLDRVKGTVVQEAWSVGYVVADIGKNDIRGLINVAGVSVVESDFQPDTKNHQTDFFVGNHGWDTRTDVEDFVNEGYEGGQPNVGRHGYYDMLAAVSEINYFEDEACSFQDGPNNCGNHSTDHLEQIQPDLSDIIRNSLDRKPPDYLDHLRQMLLAYRRDPRHYKLMMMVRNCFRLKR